MERKWWHDKVVYQIYPKSFYDANNDGIGDIPGIIEKLDYLKDLGVDILWLTPCFRSPMKDNGYDVADYREINPMFGTNEDMDRLMKEAKKRGMGIMLDIVANHTSDQHAWFQQALQGKDNPYRDYYIFRDEPKPAIDSVFGGSAWEYEPHSKQYYLHEFAVGQPDLNTANPKVREEMIDIINYWLDKGAVGFRFDVIHLLGKEVDRGIFGYGPRLHEYVRQMADASFGRRDAVTVGEAWGDIQNAVDFTLPSRHELNMVFQFEVTTLSWSQGPMGKFAYHQPDMDAFKSIFAKYQDGLNDRGWNSLFLENHDSGRSVDVFGSTAYRYESATALATALYLQKGTPFIYQGQEIGLTNSPMALEDYDDVEIFGQYKALVEGGVCSKEAFLEGVYKNGRDNARIPLPWNASINGGFNAGATPWLKPHRDYATLNVEAEQGKSRSVLTFYKKLLKLRKGEFKNTFVYGDFALIYSEVKDFFAYQRNGEDGLVYVMVNLSKEAKHIELLAPVKRVLLQNQETDFQGKTSLDFGPYEAVVFTL
ncbi:MAG: alpha-glucosidase [Bacilli bacterium]|nr:alpha-glucosidase [Bacilli bacterium]